MSGTDWRLTACKGCGARVIDAEFCDLCYAIDEHHAIDGPAHTVYKESVKPSLPEFVRGARVKRK